MSVARPPSLGLLLRELPHVIQIWTGRWRGASTVEGLILPDQDPPPVMVVPGLMSNDNSTLVLRRTLRQSGFAAYPSEMGFMRGITKGHMKRAERQLHQISQMHDGPVALIGWSLGGLYARVLAQRHPELVKIVMTLGTPFSGSRKANNAWRVYELLNDHSVDAPPVPDDVSAKPSVHTVAIWSSLDGVIAPHCARGADHERDVEIEIIARHLTFGAGHGPARKITEILASELAKAQPPTSAVST